MVTISVTKWLIQLALDEEVPAVIPGRTNFGNELFLICPSLRVLGNAPE